MHHRDLEQYKAGGDSTSIPFILFKILYEAPLTMTLMTPQCWSAVSGCSKQLRHLIQQKTRVVYVDHLDEVDAEHHRRRPQLCLIIVRKPCAIHDKCITSFLLRTHLSTYPQRSSIAFLLVSTPPDMHAQLFMKQHKFAAKAIAVLTADQLPCSKKLDLSDIRLRATAVEQLGQGVGHDLAELKLNRTNLDNGLLAQTFTGFWPKLEVKIQLSGQRCLCTLCFVYGELCPCV